MGVWDEYMPTYALREENNKCNGCCHNKDNKCTRVGTNGQIGVCWMAPSEGEY